MKLLLKALPPAQREVVACMIDTFTLQEIAQMLGKTEATVRQNLCAARKRLRSYLAGTGTDAGSTISRKGADERQQRSHT